MTRSVNMLWRESATKRDVPALKGFAGGERVFGARGQNHSARTATQAFVVHISGYGPTDTRYFDPANEPKS
jgi:hypothetical protein